jgi:ornithine cyclodeaminase/alanine dehydrogenase-like protein (mu-crystallin family)
LIDAGADVHCKRDQGYDALLDAGHGRDLARDPRLLELLAFQVIVGRYTGRAHAQDVTLFKSLGIAIEDLAVAARVYAKAQAAGVGRVTE